MIRGYWVLHPESPGMRVWVLRGVWGRLFKPTDFATLKEAMKYQKTPESLKGKGLVQ